MAEQEKQENQKTIVAFAAGLLIGGLLVWIFGGNPEEKKVEEKETEQTKSEEVKVSEVTGETTTETTEEKKPEMQVGEGKIMVKNQATAKTVAIDSATFPTDEGWVGVRDYSDGKVGYILGVARYSKSQGLIPAEVALQRSTIAGKEYAIVFFKESGDRKFNAAVDTQLEGTVATFKAN